MDLVKADPKRIASLILKGKRELDEVPRDRRAVVKHQIVLLERERQREKLNERLNGMSYPRLLALHKKVTGNEKRLKKSDVVEILLAVEDPFSVLKET